MLPETHPRLKARCRGEHTLSTKVDEETNRWLGRQAKMADVSKAEVVRRVLDYYRLKPEEINEEVEL